MSKLPTTDNHKNRIAELRKIRPKTVPHKVTANEAGRWKQRNGEPFPVGSRVVHDL